MPILFTCSCSKKLQVRDELAGKNVRCPGCGATLRVPASRDAESTAQGSRPAAARPAASRAKLPAFPALGTWIGGTAVVVGCLMIAGGVLITAATLAGDGEFKPAGLIVFGFPGVLWTVFGSLLLRLRQRFVTPFWAFLMVNLLVGVFFTTQAGRLGGRGEARIFAAIGLGFIVGSLLFQLFHGFLLRDVRRQAAAAAKGSQGLAGGAGVNSF